jgi:hypothetical protein
MTTLIWKVGITKNKVGIRMIKVDITKNKVGITKIKVDILKNENKIDPNTLPYFSMIWKCKSLDDSVRVIDLRLSCDDMNSKSCSFYC